MYLQQVIGKLAVKLSLSHTIAVFFILTNLTCCCANTYFFSAKVDYMAILNFPCSQTIGATDITSCVKALLHTDSDLTVIPVMDNPKVQMGSIIRHCVF